ncbi:lipid IV(A) 3-deoxy-D-manno-octulosonic acid transferase [Pseudomonas matsuisoli]|uniref:3-deoxy-D-manno-octulosonic acid transferase n=1 Tax=Pseudomonas matsuisoli TaxID=1515666 RepID=A0A917V1R2_9PSED|nr:lipid IV(A) 3-deoxy-D-manno-octulosonic acid transferase [Pseudomonas matsuisoli]GGK09333.1 3-deoxy-D-manno-octulosonic acid transferase [Pseudomonas matsuisoli]
MNRFVYSCLLHLAVPFILVKLFLRARKAPAYAKRIGERFSLGLPACKPGGLWVHAVSVGESIAAAPMIRALQARYPDLPITVTCMTPTGSERIQALFGDQVQHCYLPYDLPCAAKRFLDHVQPRVGIIMETELWPNHIHQATRRGIPMVLANARLSERSARGYARFAKLTAPMLRELDFIAVQTDTEAKRFLSLGAREAAVQVTGSIKFDLTVDAHLIDDAQQLRESWGAIERPVWIAASTHEGEDQILLAAHRRLLEKYPDALLILVPRHPERFKAVHTLCQARDFVTERRSTGTPVTAAISVLVGDTMGELLFLYALADCAFVGGSLVPNGGHNLLEPAALGKPVLSGPHVFNFLEIAEQLEKAGALRITGDERELAEAIAGLWASPEDANLMRAGALQVLRANQGALQRLVNGVALHIDRH